MALMARFNSSDGGAAVFVIIPLLPPVVVSLAIQYTGVESASHDRIKPLIVVSQRLQRWNDQVIEIFGQLANRGQTSWHIKGQAQRCFKSVNSPGQRAYIAVAAATSRLGRPPPRAWGGRAPP
jgi:hypothetical protein